MNNNSAPVPTIAVPSGQDNKEHVAYTRAEVADVENPEESKHNDTSNAGVPRAAPVSRSTRNAWAVDHYQFFQTEIPSGSVIIYADSSGTESIYPTSPKEIALLNIYRVSLYVRLVAVIQIILLVITAFFVPVIIIILPFPICGYFGARLWITCCLIVYAIYLMLDVVGTIISVVLAPNPGFLILRLIYLFVIVMILSYTIRLISCLLKLEPEDLLFLKSSDAVRRLERESGCCC